VPELLEQVRLVSSKYNATYSHDHILISCSEYDNRDTTGVGSGIGSGSSNVGTGTGPAPNTAGPHSKDWMNKLDPRVDAQPSSAYPTQIGSKNTDSSKDGHHLGRDAAVAGGAGGAAYEYEHHKHDKDLTQAERDAKKQHKHDLKEEKKHHHDEKSHLGRDTAVAGGAGGAAYEAEKHHKHKDIDQTTGKDHHLGRDSAAAGGAGGAAVAGDSMWDKLHKPTETNQPQGSVHSGTLAGTGTGYSDTIPSETKASSQTTGDHHYGRDAALGGAALGAGGLAEHEHNKHESTATSGATHGARQGSVTGTGKSEYDPEFARAEL
jgi:hypothetical protein